MKYVPKGNSKNDKVLTKNKSKSKTGGNRSKKHSNKNDSNNKDKTFYYVYMVNCPYCIKFDKTGIFETLRG